MPNVVHRFEEPERFVVGTVGPPGQRTFFLQARDGSRVVSVALEKQQVAVLAERLDLLLDHALRELGGDPSIPAVVADSRIDQNPLDHPIDEQFRVGTITLGWEPERGRAVIELFSVVESDESDETEGGEEATDVAASAAVSAMADEGDDDEEDDELDESITEAEEVVVVTLDPAYARGFVQRANRVVSAGRPTCQFCGGPIDPDGHLCPRANGFRRTAV